MIRRGSVGGRPALRRIDLGASFRRTRVHGGAVRVVGRQRHVVHRVRLLVAALLRRVVARALRRPLVLLAGWRVGPSTHQAPVIRKRPQALSDPSLGMQIAPEHVQHDGKQDDEEQDPSNHDARLCRPPRSIALIIHADDIPGKSGHDGNVPRWEDRFLCRRKVGWSKRTGEEELLSRSTGSLAKGGLTERKRKIKS